MAMVDTLMKEEYKKPKQDIVILHKIATKKLKLLRLSDYNGVHVKQHLGGYAQGLGVQAYQPHCGAQG